MDINRQTKKKMKMMRLQKTKTKASQSSEEEVDDESDLVALMTASSTITNTNKARTKLLESASLPLSSASKKEIRKFLEAKQKESTIQLLSVDLNENQEETEQRDRILINYFLDTVKQSLGSEDYTKFLVLLSNLYQSQSESSSSNFSNEAFFQIEEFLKKSQVDNDLVDALVLFLDDSQAKACGKTFDYLYWKRFSDFIRKLEIYFSGDVQCFQRLIRTLKHLKQNDECLNKAKIKAAISKILNGHAYLMNELSSLFLDEKPSEYLLRSDEDFEEIKIDEKDNQFENINIPLTSDELKYGTNECPCKVCHQNDSPQSSKHCISCSIKFIGGRIYMLQSNKKYHLAEVRYEKVDETDSIHNNSEDIDEKNSQRSKIIKSETIKQWTKEEDKILLELCRSKVINEQTGVLGKETFEEAASKLFRSVNECIVRFNYLIEIFAQSSSNDMDDIEIFKCD